MSVAAVSRSGHSGDGVTKATGDLRDRARQNGAVAAQTKDNLQDDELSKMKQLLMGKLKSDVDVAVSLEDIVPGKQIRAKCPECSGGTESENCFSLYIHDSFSGASFKCFRAKCGFKGSVFTAGHTTSHRAVAGNKAKQPYKPPVAEEEMKSPGSATEDYFRRNFGIGPSEALAQCGVRQADHAVLSDPGDKPSSYAVIPFTKRGVVTGMASIDLLRPPRPGRRGKEDDWVAGAGMPSARDLSMQLEMVMEWPDTSEPTLWGYDMAMELVSDAEAKLDLLVVEDVLERLAMVEAGFPPGCVVALPPGARKAFASRRLPRREASSVRDPGSRGLGRRPRGSSSGAQWSKDDKAMAEQEAIGYMIQVDDLLNGFGRIVLALRTDPVSASLADELARVISPGRCCRLQWPAAADELYGSSPESEFHDAWRDEHRDQPLPASSSGFTHSTSRTPFSGIRNGAHDMLLRDGREALKWHAINMIVDWPLNGLFQIETFRQEILDYYHQANASSIPATSGWPGLDGLYKVVPGELTVVTGIPNSGKSEWLDALAVNLMYNHDWHIAFCSFEKSPKHHAAQLAEKIFGQPVLKRDDGSGAERMSPETFREALDEIDSCFYLIRRDGDELPGGGGGLRRREGGGALTVPSSSSGGGWTPSYMTAYDGVAEAACQQAEEVPSIEWVLKKAEVAVRRYGIRGLVIDPYNELDHSRPPHMQETNFISSMLSKIKTFAQLNEVHVWLVAHPRQLADWQGKAPTLYDISGSAHFINKADCGIVVHRSWEGAMDDNKVKIMVSKIRNKAAGKIGTHELVYDRETGRYEDINAM